MLVYSLVARGSVILAEHTQGSHTSAVGIAKDLLKKLGADKNSRKSVSHDMYTFSLITDEHLTFLVSSTESSPRLFSFLGDIKDRWYNTFGDKGNDAQMLAMNGQFSRTLQDRMEYYSEDQVSTVKKQLDDVQNIMSRNIDSVIARGESLEDIHDRSSHLASSTADFKRASSDLKWYMQKKNIKLMIGLAILILLVFYFIIAGFCGIVFQECL